MIKQLSQLSKYLLLFSVMGAAYMAIEYLWRGYSHFSMFLLAGSCGVLIGLLNNFLPEDTPVWIQMLIGTGIILTGEFFSGCLLNLWLGLDIWDYSDVPFNILGQICLPFAFAWFFLSLIAVVINDYLRYWLFGEAKPHYCWKLRDSAKTSTVSDLPRHAIRKEFSLAGSTKKG